MGHYGLLGKQLGHSYSPTIHGLFGSVPYDLYEVQPEELEDFLRSANWDGLNVTIPYKKAVVNFCQELSPLAQRLGSVNTLIRRPDGSIYGDNTDYDGFLSMVKRINVSCAGKKALVLGSGGASVTVQAVLQELGAEVVVISRSGENNYENLARHADAAILVNATPVGMYPDNGVSPVMLDAFPRLEAVLDLIYNPSRTTLMLSAERLNIPCISGLYMLVAQATRASELFTGKAISREMTEDAWRKIGLDMENLILVGMPGCGKTAVGTLLAKALGRPFWDADMELEKVTGIPAGEYIRLHGEDAFRKAETAVLRKLGAISGAVIATGGGCVTREENYPLLHQNGRIFWLTRNLSLLPKTGRPLSQTLGIEALYEARKDSYHRFADRIIPNDGTPEEAVQTILEVLHP